MSEWVAELVAARLATGATCVLLVRTGSMAPLLLPGDAVRVVALGGERPRRGALLVVRQGNFLVTHRLVGWVETGVDEQMLLQGDACPHPDRPAPAHSVLGLVVARRRGGQWRNLRSGRWHWMGMVSWVHRVGRGVWGSLLRRAQPPISAMRIIIKEQP